MKNFLIAFCLFGLIFFVGCGKQGENDKSKKMVVAQSLDQEIPIYRYDEDNFFDENDDNGDIADFTDDVYAFIKDDDEAGSQEQLSSEASVASYDDWDDKELPLVWQDESEEDIDFQTVNFDLNKNEIRKDQKVKVVKNVETAKEVVKSGKNVVIVGHCCPIGSASYNMSLSEKRARVIRDEMVKSGLPGGQVKVLGCGSECPVVLSDSADRAEMIKELAPNRRAEISVV